MQKDFTVRYLLHKLLLEQDFIIIPDFGTFIAHPSPAKLDRNFNRFIKPQKTIQFNPRIKQNDGVLSHACSLEFGISLDDAFQQIQDEIKFFVTSRTPMEFNNVGIITFNLDGSLDFIPNTTADLDDTNFGLDNVMVQPVQVLQPKVISLEEPIYTKTSNKKIVLAAASIALCLFSYFSWKIGLAEQTSETLLGWTFAGTPTYKTYSNIEDYSYSDIDSESFKLVPGKRISLYYLSESTIEEEAIFLEDPLVKTSISMPSGNEMQYKSIVVAAFSKENLAKDFCMNLTLNNIKPTILKNSNNLFLIGVGNFPNQESAESQLPSIQKIYPGAWIR